MNPVLYQLERIPATLLVVLAVVSINLGAALAISLFPLYGTSGMLFLRMGFGAVILMLAYRRQLIPAIRQLTGCSVTALQNRNRAPHAQTRAESC